MCQPTEGGKNRPAGLGWTLQEAIKHTPQQLEFVLATEAEIKALERRIAMDEDRANGKLPSTSREELEEYRRQKRLMYTGTVKSPIG